ncbi:MAG: GntR family transcriptional regulator, partial [Candidatus Nanopelagicales bacterium]
MSVVTRRLLRDEAYDALRAAIVSGDLEPGAILSEGDLADWLGVSRAPVRAALARLVDDGLVETKPQSFT